jgi:hypothetical protein
MMATTFDTLKFVEKLKEAGVPDPQARVMCEVQKEILAEVSESTLATKADLLALKADFSALKESTRADFSALKESTRADFSALKESTRADFSVLKESFFVLKESTTADIAALRASTKADFFALTQEILKLASRVRLTEWMLGLLVAGMTSLIFKAFFST